MMGAAPNENPQHLVISQQNNSTGSKKAGGAANQSDIYKVYMNYVPNNQNPNGQ